MMPTTAYNRTIWTIKDYPRLKSEYDQLKNSAAASASAPCGSNVEEVTTRLADLEAEICQMQELINTIPADMREGIMDNICYEKSFPKNEQGKLVPSLATWKHEKQKFIVLVAHARNIYHQKNNLRSAFVMRQENYHQRAIALLRKQQQHMQAYKLLEDEIIALEKQQQSNAIRVMDYNCVRSGKTNRTASSVESDVVHREELQKKINELRVQLDRLRAQEMDINLVLDSLPEQYAKVLQLRYIYGYKWALVVEQMPEYSLYYIKSTLNKESLQMFCEIYYGA